MNHQYAPISIRIESASSSVRLSHPLAKLIGFSLMLGCFLVHFCAIGITPSPVEVRSMAALAEQADLGEIAYTAPAGSLSHPNFDQLKPAPLGTMHDIPSPFQTVASPTLEVAPTFLSSNVQETLVALHYGF